MAHLYLTEQGAVLRKTGDRLIVLKDDRILLDVPCNKIDAVLIFGNVQFTTQAVHELFEHGIEMAILSQRGRLLGQLTSPATKNIELRLAQFKRYFDHGFRLRVGKSIVQAKAENSVRIMRSFSTNHPEKGLETEINNICALAKSIPAAETIPALLGIEGSVARHYFQGFSRMILSDLPFDGRRKRPPPDPVNALLSFSYTLVFNEISSLLDGLGFDPFLGYLHEPDYGRPSLASDLIEEFRAILCDRLTLYLVNNRILQTGDFYSNPKGGVYLNQEAMKRYFAEYEHFLTREFRHPVTNETTSFRRCFRLQAEEMARGVREDGLYRPLLFTD